uniref:Uncharacterized protein n=1 Tax=Oryza meridionalis TaxID=40149 RepID=A0A0E0E0H1_9ORYZ
MAAPGSSSGSGGIPIKADQDSDGSAQSTADMTAFVQNLLMQMMDFAAKANLIKRVSFCQVIIITSVVILLFISFWN